MFPLETSFLKQRLTDAIASGSFPAGEVVSAHRGMDSGGCLAAGNDPLHAGCGWLAPGILLRIGASAR